MNNTPPFVLSVNVYRFGLSFIVQGQSSVYTVDWNIYKGWICDCPDHLYRKSLCKHIQVCIDYAMEHGLLLHGKLWVDDPKSDVVMV